MTTLDLRELDTVSGGTLDSKPGRLLPSDLSPPPLPTYPTLPRLPSTIPLGPYDPPPARSDIA